MWLGVDDLSGVNPYTWLAPTYLTPSSTRYRSLAESIDKVGIIVLEILYYLIKVIQPVMPYVCFFCAWLFLILLGWSLLNGASDAIARSKKMHQRPCSKCRYFTNDFRLKCTVQPTIANTEQAIDCFDYCPSDRIC